MAKEAKTSGSALKDIFDAMQTLHEPEAVDGPALMLGVDDFETVDGYVSSPGDIQFLAAKVPAEFLRRAAAVSEAISRSGDMAGIESIRLEGELFGCAMGCANEVPDGAMDGVSPDGRYSASAVPDDELPWPADELNFQDILSVGVEITPHRIAFYDPDEGFGSWWNPRIEVARDDVPQILAACVPADAESEGPRL